MTHREEVYMAEDAPPEFIRERRDILRRVDYDNGYNNGYRAGWESADRVRTRSEAGRHDTLSTAFVVGALAGSGVVTALFLLAISLFGA